MIITIVTAVQSTHNQWSLPTDTVHQNYFHFCVCVCWIDCYKLIGFIHICWLWLHCGCVVPVCARAFVYASYAWHYVNPLIGQAEWFPKRKWKKKWINNYMRSIKWSRFVVAPPYSTGTTRERKKIVFFCCVWPQRVLKNDDGHCTRIAHSNGRLLRRLLWTCFLGVFHFVDRTSLAYKLIIWRVMANRSLNKGSNWIF